MQKVDYTRFTRAELVRTIEVLVKRERDLLNVLAQAGVMPWQITEIKKKLDAPPVTVRRRVTP